MMNATQLLRVSARRIETLNLNQASAFLHMSGDSLRRKAKRGDVPGACKIGRSWVFIKADLIRWMRAGSPCVTMVGGKQCQLSNGMDSGILMSPSKAQAEYENLLDYHPHPQTSAQRKNGMTHSRLNCGDA